MQAVLGQASVGGERGQSPEARRVSPRLNGDVKARCQETKTEKMVEWGSREQRADSGDSKSRGLYHLGSNLSPHNSRFHHDVSSQTMDHIG